MAEKNVLDYKGLCCPLPVLKANKALKAMISGDVAEILATDPSAPADFVAFCDTTGHHLVSSDEADGVYTIVIRKS